MNVGPAAGSLTAKQRSLSAAGGGTTALVVDLGQSKSLTFRYELDTRTFETVTTTPPPVHDLLAAAAQAVLAIEE